jgi:hypothetical protein
MKIVTVDFGLECNGLPEKWDGRLFLHRLKVGGASLGTFTQSWPEARAPYREFRVDLLVRDRDPNNLVPLWLSRVWVRFYLS